MICKNSEGENKKQSRERYNGTASFWLICKKLGVESNKVYSESNSDATINQQILDIGSFTRHNKVIRHTMSKKQSVEVIRTLCTSINAEVADFIAKIAIYGGAALGIWDTKAIKSLLHLIKTILYNKSTNIPRWLLQIIIVSLPGAVLTIFLFFLQIEHL